jgi:hypothetical protein
LYTLLPFTEDNLASSLVNNFTFLPEIKRKSHFAYLLQYLNDINAKTIVIEDKYISKDYLHDYTSYYSLCFEPYPKFCKRVHFFELDLSEEIFNSLIMGSQFDIDYKGSYLGFVVVKPIPHTVVGFTVLKTYPDSSERTYWGIKNYAVNLFGLDLNVKSLAFQEQDTVVAACATAAIWTMLHGAVQNCNHTILLKSPSEITRDAGNSSDGNRLFPNKGLEISQICESISKAGLVSEIKSENIDSIRADHLRKFLNAYSATGIPLILVIRILKNEKLHGLHAITVCGFYKEKPAAIDVKDEMSFMSDRITKFYAHDDQFGPFARIKFDTTGNLITPWNEDDPINNQVLIESIIVSVYPKIRISYEEIEVIVRAYDFILSNFFNEYVTSDLVWDIKLLLNRDFKKYLQALNTAEYPNKIDLLTENYPRYIWIASCHIGEERILDFTFDATGVNQAMLGLNIISHLDEDLNKYVIENLLENKTAASLDVFDSPSCEQYYDFLLEEMGYAPPISS